MRRRTVRRRTERPGRAFLLLHGLDLLCAEEAALWATDASAGMSPPRRFVLTSFTGSYMSIQVLAAARCSIGMRAHLPIVFVQRPGDLECGLEKSSLLDSSQLLRVDAGWQRSANTMKASPLSIYLVPVHLE